MEYLHDKEDENLCWICLEPCLNASLCNCKTYVHSICLAQWQMRKAGTTEETHCRMCSKRLFDWRYVLHPEYRYLEKNPVQVRLSDGQTIVITADMTKEDFAEVMKSMYEVDIVPNITFQCKMPNDPTKTVTFDGIECFDAVMFCTRVATNKRKQHYRQRRFSRGLQSQPSSLPLSQPTQQEQQTQPTPPTQRTQPIPLWNKLCRFLSCHS
jgi:hypothetical protein